VVQTGAIVFALIVGVLLAAVASWVVAWLYRRRMVELMRGGPAPDLTGQGPEVPPAVQETRAPVSKDPAANRRASIRLLLALTVLCLLIGLTQSWLALQFVYEADRGFSLKQTLVVGAVYAWPMVLAWGLARRWSWWRVLGGVLAYMLLMMFPVMLLSGTRQMLSGVGAWLALQVATPMMVTLFIGGSGRIRAVAPYLLPPFLLLSAASVISLEILAASVESQSAWERALVGSLGAYGTVLMFVLLPWVLMAWPVYALGRCLAEAYRAKRFSDLGYLFAVYWFVVLFTSALTALGSVGPEALIQILAWLWIPLGWGGLKRWLAPRESSPTLLVLRVFQRDAQVEQLFDRVIERWRLTGNTLLIAGTDLLSRTLDPDELFAYFNGRLAERFVASKEQVSARVAGLDMAPDPDGRYRVNECYCFDATWRSVLAALVHKADVALMDLRGFGHKAKNLGCIHELGVLAKAPHLQRVVLLYDQHTKRPEAEAAMAGAPAGRFEWLDAGRMYQAMAGRVLAALFATGGGGRQATTR